MKSLTPSAQSRPIIAAHAFCLITLLSLLEPPATRAELILSAGDSYSFSFSTLAFQTNLPPRSFVGVTYLLTVALYLGSDYDVPTLGDPSPNSDLLEIHPFSDELFQQAMPIPTYTTLPWPPYIHFTGEGSGWEDLDGSLQIQMIQGSVTVESADIKITFFDDVLGRNIYGTSIVLVPEIASEAFTGFLLLGFLEVCRRRRKPQSNKRIQSNPRKARVADARR